MSGYATVNLSGVVSEKPELRYSPAGDPVVSFTVEVSRKVESGAIWKDFIKCMRRGDKAEQLSQEIEKGATVDICGRLVQKRWQDRRGGGHSEMVVSAESVSLVRQVVGCEA